MAASSSQLSLSGSSYHSLPSPFRSIMDLANWMLPPEFYILSKDVTHPHKRRCGSGGSILTRYCWLCDRGGASIQLISPVLIPDKNPKSPESGSLNSQLLSRPSNSLPKNSLWLRLACHFLCLQPWSLIDVPLSPEKWMLCKHGNHRCLIHLCFLQCLVPAWYPVKGC